MSSHPERQPKDTLAEMHMDAKYAEERARRIQQLDDPRQVRQMLGVIAARMMRYLTG